MEPAADSDKEMEDSSEIARINILNIFLFLSSVLFLINTGSFVTVALENVSLLFYNTKYFRARFNVLGRKDWLTLTWKPATEPHTLEEDGTSCGVFVMEVK